MLNFDEAVFRNHYPVHHWCRVGDFLRVGQLLGNQPQLASTEEPFQNWTPIHWAAHFGQLDCLRRVASIDPNLINIQSSKTFQTPLHCAASGGDPHCTRWLLQAGTNPEVKDSIGETALHKAAEVGSAECVSLLVAVSLNLGSQNLNGQTASAVADANGHRAIAAFIHQRELENRRFHSVRSGRKRVHDSIVCDEAFSKRMRADDLRNASSFMDSSVADHDHLCTSEQGYRNTLVECMLSEYQGW